MRVNFFEEYPGDGGLEPAALVDFPSTVFVAAESVEAYRAHSDELAAINPALETAYWPVLPESYWISPFADAEELESLFEATAGFEDPVFLDLELPVGRPELFVRNAGEAIANRRRIRQFVQAADGEVVTGEYPPVPAIDWLWEPLGLTYDGSLGHTRCPMYYTSVLPDGLVEPVGDAVEAMVRGDDRVLVGLGTIASGVFEDEPILSPAELERDLDRLASAGAEEVVVFRLGGLDEAYLDVIEQFVD